VSEPTYQVTPDGTVYVGLELAHPMREEYAERARALEVRDYEVGETIYVLREYGNALIENGQVQVDPENVTARREALFLNRRNQPLTVKEIDAKQARWAAAANDDSGDDGKAGDGDADAATPAPVEGQQSAADAPSAETRGKTAKSRS
jgi:hypothetical protein